MGEYYPFEVAKVHKLSSLFRDKAICGRRTRRYSRTVIGVTCKNCLKKGVELIYIDSDGNKSEMIIRKGQATYISVKEKQNV